MADDDKTWMDGSEEPEIQITEYDITSTPNDFNVLTINSFLDKGAIVLPRYQRSFTWDKARASKLIESLILGLPVPQLFLYEEGRNKFAILDGQQRLLSIYFFTKRRFPKKSQRTVLRDIFAKEGGFAPKVLQDDDLFEAFNIYLPAKGGEEKSQLHGLNYETLQDNHRSAFDLRPLRCVIIKQNEPKDDNSSVYEIFDRLNTGGVNLNPQEIRANLYISGFYEFLYEANKDKRWRHILGKADRDEKLRDIELLLRAFAMLCYSAQYSPSMTRFLNRFSNYAKKNFDADTVSHLKAIFESLMAALDGLEPGLFRLSDRFSIAIFEALLVGRYQKCFDKKSDPKEIGAVAADDLKKLADGLREKVQEGTTKKDNVLKRLEVAKELLEPK
ncbi:MAG: DUF262 domain-containing protein [Proteobacteria bacterium]|nr:DUF262 domain-containing protein [Pseudomonadota bacterium]